MFEADIIRDIGVMIISAALLVMIARVIRMPSIVAYILAGLILGPMLGLVEITTHDPDVPDGSLDLITHLGIALLLFLVGMELSFAKIRDAGRISCLVGLAQIAFITLFGFALGWLTGIKPMASLFIAAALTNSSTVLVVKLLDEKRETNQTYGHIIVGANLVKDVALIVVLTVLAGLSAAESMVLREAAWTLLVAGLGMTGLVALAMLSSRYWLTWPFTWAATAPQMLFIWSLTWCLLFAGAAEWLGLSPAIGAFLAGISLAQLPMADDLRRRVHPLMNFFLAIFFVAVGVQMKIGAAITLWPAFMLLGLFMLVGVPLFTMWVTSRSGYSRRTSFLAGVSMGQISELSFVFAAVGMASGIITQVEILSLITLLGLVTIAISAYLILYNRQLYVLFLRRGWLNWLEDHRDTGPPAAPPLRDHVIVVGMNALGRRLAADLHRRGQRVLAIDTDQRKLEGLPCRTLVGNVEYLPVLDEAGLAAAKLGISALQIEDTNNLFAYRCKQYGVPVAIHAFDRSVVDPLKRMNVDLLIDPRRESQRQLRQQLDEALAAQTARAATMEGGPDQA